MPKTKIKSIVQKIEINQQKEEILNKNEELIQQKEEIIVQRDLLDDTNKELGMINVYLAKLSTADKDRNVAIIIADEKGNIEWVNNDFIKLYGFTLENYIFHYPSLFKRADHKDEIVKQLKENLPYQYEFESKTKSDETKHIKSTLYPIIDNNKLVKVIAIDTEMLDKI